MIGKIGLKWVKNISKFDFNPLMPGGKKRPLILKQKKVAKLQLKATGLFKYVRHFCYHQALKG